MDQVQCPRCGATMVRRVTTELYKCECIKCGLTVGGNTQEALEKAMIDWSRLDESGRLLHGRAKRNEKA